MIKKLVPYPLLTIALLMMWLLLQQSLSLGHFLLGTAVALLAGKGMQSLAPEKPRIRFCWAMVKLAGYVLADIVRSNVAVGQIILAGHGKGHKSGFMELPLDMTNRYGLAVLGIVLTATPGTLWVQYNSRRNTLLMHVLDLVDEAHWVHLIKTRYERLLMEIFE